MAEKFDINTFYSSLAERLAAAKSALRSSTFGRGGIISIETEGDQVRFRIPLLGKVYDNIMDAVNGASALGVTESFSFAPGQTNILPGSKVNAPASIYESVYSQLQNLSAADKKILRDAGINPNDLRSLKVDFSTMRSKGTGGAKAVAERIEKFRERGVINGITVMDDEGARLIQFRTDQGLLSAYQSNLLLAITGHDQLAPEAFGGILRDQDAKGLAKKLGKLGKRMKGFLAERDVSLVGNELANFLKAGKATDLGKATLVLDPQYEILKIFASLNFNENNFMDVMRSPVDLDDLKAPGFSKGVKAFYGDIAPAEYMGNIFKAALNDKSLGYDSISELKAVINSYNGDPGQSGWRSAALKDHLMKNFAGTDKSRAMMVNNIFASIEYAYDGSDILNARYLNGYRKTLIDEKRDLEKTLARKGTSAKGKEAAAIRVKELDSLIDNLRDSTSLQQITGRGFLPGRGAVKTAFEVKDLINPALDNFAAIITKFSFKEETSLAGKVPSLILSGLGQGRESVYVDPVAAAFNPQIFADPDSIKAIMAHGESVLADFEAAVDNNALPEKLLNQIKNMASTNVDSLPPQMQSSALKNRQFAQELMRLHQSGASPRNSPRMMNMLHKFFATQAFREKDGFIQAVMPDTYRFAIDSEAIVAGGERRLLGEGFENIGSMKFGKEVIDIDQDILKFRVNRHKMLFSAQAIGEFRHSLGGFDLDDKGLPRLRTYTDNNGKNRLGFYIFRQPSGPEETIFARSSFDSDTVKALFDNRHFNETLDQLISGKNANPNLITLKDVISGNKIDGYAADDIEQAIFEVYKGMEKRKITKLGRITRKEAERIQQYGSSSLRVTPSMLRGELGLEDYSPQYHNDKVFKVMTESGAFDMSSELRSVVEKAPINSQMKKAILSSQSFEEMMGILGEYRGTKFENSKQARAVLATAFQMAAEERAKQAAGSLGSYVNRSMLTGSMLQQYEDMYGAIKDVNVQKFLRENYNIGLVAQEEAIDLSVNFSGTRQLQAQVLQQISQSTNVNDVGLAKAVAELMGIKQGEITLDVLGETSITNLGKLMGFSSTLGVKDELKIGLDKFLLETRLSQGDAEKIARGMLVGLEDAKAFSADTDVIDTRIQALQKVVDTKDDQQILDYLIKTVGLGPQSQYANLSRLQESGMLLKQYLETTKKMKLAAMGRDEILASTQTSKEASAVAAKIIENNRDMLSQVMQMHNLDVADMTEQQKVANRQLMDQVGTSVYRQIDEARQVAGVSMYDLVNALDKQMAGAYLDIGGFAPLMGDGVADEYREIFEAFPQVRRLREIEYYQRFDQSIADAVRGNLGSFGDPNEPVTMAKVRAQAREAIEAMSQSQLETLEGGIYQVLTDNGAQIADETMRAEAERQANIIRAQVDADEMIDTRNTLNAKGITQLADISDDADSALADLIRAANGIDDDPTVNKSTYKRITDKVDDFKKLFQEDKLFRRGTIAALTLAAGSLVYSEVRDRTVDDATGPPLLPGGNPYETAYPTRAPQIGDFGQGSYSNGMSYQVSINGSRGDIDKFNEAAGGLVNGGVSTTIYNTLPNMKRDPYSAMGQRY